MKKPNLFRTAILWLVDAWRLVMDARYNPLKYIPDPSLQAYFTIVLFTMWSFYFGFVATFYMGWLGYNILTSIIVHIGVLVPLAITNGIFIDAERNGANWVKDWRQEQDSFNFWKKITSRNYEKRVKWDIDKEA